MKKLFRISVLVSILAVLSCSLVFAGVGTSGAQFLKINMSANSSSLGEAGAVSAGAESVFLNPAGIYSSKGLELMVSQGMWIEDIKFSNLSAVKKFNFGVMGIGVNYLTVPSITKVDNTGTELTDTYAPSDMLVNLSYARRVAGLTDVGVSLKYVSSTIDDATASAIAADIGVIRVCSEINAKVGLVVQHLGTEMKFDAEGDPLPMNVKLGGKYVIPIKCELDENLDASHGVGILVDANLMNDSGFFANTGVEYNREFSENFDTAIRIGYKTFAVEGLSSAGLSAGLGLIYDKYGLDYAYAPYGDLGQVHKIALSFKF